MIGGNKTDYMADVIGGDDIMVVGAVTTSWSISMAQPSSAVRTATISSRRRRLWFARRRRRQRHVRVRRLPQRDLHRRRRCRHLHHRFGTGPTTVTDFEDGVDHIYLWDNHYYGNFPLESLTIADSAAGAVVSFNGVSEMMLTGIHASQLTQDDFVI